MNSSSAAPETGIAFVHDWLTTFGGGEQVLSALLELWPAAPVYTLVHDPDGPCGTFSRGRDVHTSFIQKLPGAKRNHRRYLPLMPLAVEQFDLRGYDVLVSISHAVAHGVLPQPDQLHINYICTPMRYAWHLSQEYQQQAGLQKGLRGWLAKWLMHYLRQWDLAAAGRVDQFVAISNWTARNVWRAYRRPAAVIYPPVDTGRFELTAEKDPYFITISRLVPYKRLDLLVQAFNRLPDKKLLVVGDGPDLPRLRRAAEGNIQFLGFLPFAELKASLSRARALVYAAVEDFGIVPLEAQACGTPVIAYGKGGALETVIDGQTGLLYHEHSAEALVAAVGRFETLEAGLDRQAMRLNAARFDKSRFQDEFAKYVESSWAEFQAAAPGGRR